MDDSETFQFFCELLKRYKRNVIVVNPHPEYIASAIQNETKLRTVYTLPVYWDHLSRAIIDNMIVRQNKFNMIQKILFAHDTFHYNCKN